MTCEPLLRRVRPLSEDPDNPYWDIDQDGLVYPSRRSFSDSNLSAVCEQALTRLGYEPSDAIVDHSGGTAYDGWGLVTFSASSARTAGCDVYHDYPPNDPIHPYNYDAHVTVTGLSGARTSEGRKAQRQRVQRLVNGSTWVEPPTLEDRRERYQFRWGGPLPG